MSVEKSFPKRLDSLDEVFGFLHEFIAESGIGDKDAFAVEVVVEELFTNMVKYSGGDDHLVAIRLDKGERGVDLQLRDFDSDPFDPAGASPVDVKAPIQERQPGGLGLHIVRTLVEDLHYEMDGRTLTISASRSLESGHV